MRNCMANLRNGKVVDENDFRFERKFIVSSMSRREIVCLIKDNDFCFSEIFHKRRVNSIYFDSSELKNYNDNVIGVCERLKIRMRWYGDKFGEVKSPKLELKIKNGELGRKLIFDLKGFCFDDNFSNEYMARIIEGSDLPDWVKIKVKHYFPVILVSYERRYFRSRNKKFRITLDMGPSFVRLKRKSNNFKEIFVNKFRNILELKYDFEHDLEASEITQDFPFRLAASSKYVFGVDLFDIV